MGKKNLKGVAFPIDWKTSTPKISVIKGSTDIPQHIKAKVDKPAETPVLSKTPNCVVDSQDRHEHNHTRQTIESGGLHTSGLVTKSGQLIAPVGIVEKSRWRPDIYINAFIPEALSAVNRSPTTFITTPAVEGIDFASYIASFAGNQFLSILEPPQPPEADNAFPVQSFDHLNSSTYGKHFENCLALDLNARIPEIRSYDLFGVVLEIKDLLEQIYSLGVPGLREGTPYVSLGDVILLRQLILDPATGLPRGMSIWLAPGGGCERGLQAPGFTGCEISAVVLGVDKAKEVLYLRAHGLILAGNPRATANVAQQLSVLSQPPRKLAKSWLNHILFPQAANGVQQESLPSAAFSQSWFDENLNYEQKKAVNAVQSKDYGNFCYLINGPPGTGKTKTICETVVQLAKDPKFPGSILLCAPSNPAADTLALRLKHHFEPNSLLRLNHFSRTFAEVPQELLSYCFVKDDLFNLPQLSKLMGYKVVVTTCQSADILVQARVTNRDLIFLQISLSSTMNPEYKPAKLHLHWTALLIDEAAQATEPETLISLAVVSPPTLNSDNQGPVFVMAGDQHQLNPRTYHKSTTLRLSLFERLSNTSVYASHPLARKTLYRTSHHISMLRPPFVNLIRNYRSHPAILAVPSSLFYENTLVPEASKTDSLLSWPAWRGRRWPVLFACNSGIDNCEDIRGVGSGWYNTREADKAVAYARDLLDRGYVSDQSDICIMSPFPAQVHLLRRLARQSNMWAINIGPVEVFQGLESRFVIICTTRARKRFLDEDELRGIGIVNERKKFNVAVTRAKEGLIVIGNPWVLAADFYWLAFMQFCWRNSLWQAEAAGTSTQAFVEANVNEWRTSYDPRAISGLERALVFKDRDKEAGSQAAERFMNGGESAEEAMWRSGLEAEEAIDPLEPDMLEHADSAIGSPAQDEIQGPDSETDSLTQN